MKNIRLFSFLFLLSPFAYSQISSFNQAIHKLNKSLFEIKAQGDTSFYNEIVIGVNQLDSLNSLKFIITSSEGQSNLIQVNKSEFKANRDVCGLNNVFYELNQLTLLLGYKDNSKKYNLRIELYNKSNVLYESHELLF